MRGPAFLERAPHGQLITGIAALRPRRRHDQDQRVPGQPDGGRERGRASPRYRRCRGFRSTQHSVGEDVGCAYTTVNGKALSEPVFRQFLKSNLPNHMVPATLVHFDCFPILGNAGKLDRKLIKQVAHERLGLAEVAGESSETVGPGA